MNASIFRGSSIVNFIRYLQRPFLATTGCALVWLTGCAATGFVVGTGIDASLPDSSNISGWELAAIPPGTAGVLVHRNGVTENVEFVCIRQCSAEAYARTYAAFLSGLPNDATLPRIGERIQLKTRGGVSSSCRFAGFDYERIWGLIGDPPVQTYAQSEKISEIILETGRRISADSLHRLLTDGAVPFLSGVIVRSCGFDEGIFKPVGPPGENAPCRLIPLGDIRHLKVPTERNNKWWGALIGFAIDVAWFALSRTSLW
jgi:hypothetical protein